ncbi:MAG: tRNA uridine-5-carboxymethylaminomethyl(34) synthesis GTPase MnmE [Halorhodospira sp.]
MPDTICAAATPPGQGGVAVVRISGPAAFPISEQVAGPLPPARQAVLRRFRAADGETLDRGLVLAFPAPGSYTGEDTVELQGHGSPAAVAAVLEALGAAGARRAGPGEFSERAFLNGRIDLTQAEAVAALIEAETEGARRAALRSLEGAFGDEVEAVTGQLIELRARVEAFLDFPEDEDAPADPPDLMAEIANVRSTLLAIRQRAEAGVRLGEGLRAVLVGPPNAGKSSLLNALTGREAAIVSATPGTTRDVVSQRAVLGARQAELLDTAGLRAAGEQDEIEREGARRARASAADADLLLVVVEAGDALRAEHHQLLRAHAPRPAVLVRTKVDTCDTPAGWWEQTGWGGHVREAWVSAVTGAGMEALRTGLDTLVAEDAGEGAWAARQRHLEALDAALIELEGAAEAVQLGSQEEIVAEALRQAQERLGEVTGRVSHEALLDRIFSSFCIGK